MDHCWAVGQAIEFYSDFCIADTRRIFTICYVSTLYVPRKTLMYNNNNIYYIIIKYKYMIASTLSFPLAKNVHSMYPMCISDTHYTRI